MYIFNITFNIESRIHEQWLKWVKNHLINDLEKINSIHKVNILKLLTEIDNGGTTYSLQLIFKSKDTFNSFESNEKEYVFDRHNSLFRGKFVTFTTLLEEV